VSNSEFTFLGHLLLSPLLFLVYVNYVWRDIDSCITLFADDCIIYRKTTNKKEIENLQKDLDTFGGMGSRKWNENKSREK
jgi:hypothetical protein